jgi:hypothetical protein
VALEHLTRIRSESAGTVNDVYLTGATGGLRKFLLRRGIDVAELELEALIPRGDRSKADAGTVGNRTWSMYARLPVGMHDPVDVLRTIVGLTDEEIQAARQQGGGSPGQKFSSCRAVHASHYYSGLQ